MVLFRGFSKSDLFSKIYGRLHAKSHEVSCSKTKFLYFSSLSSFCILAFSLKNSQIKL